MVVRSFVRSLAHLFFLCLLVCLSVHVCGLVEKRGMGLCAMTGVMPYPVIYLLHGFYDLVTSSSASSS